MKSWGKVADELGADKTAMAKWVWAREASDEISRLREQVRVLREALQMWMALDKTFGVTKISTLHSIIADGDDSAPVADAVLKTRAALEATKP